MVALALMTLPLKVDRHALELEVMSAGIALIETVRSALFLAIGHWVSALVAAAVAAIWARLWWKIHNRRRRDRAGALAGDKSRLRLVELLRRQAEEAR